IAQRATVLTSGPDAPEGGTNLLDGVTPFGQRRFEWVGDKLMQRSMLQENLEWPVKQVLDTIDPTSPDYNEKARLAKTIQRDGATWGALPDTPGKLAHADDKMACFTCHS